MIPDLRKLVEAVHQEGGKIAFQLAHAGRQTTKAMIGQLNDAAEEQGYTQTFSTKGGNTMKKFLLVIGMFFLTACGVSALKIVEMDSKTGHFPSDKKAAVVKKTAIDIDSRKSLILVFEKNFAKGMVENIGYFEKVITLDDLEKIIIRNNLSDKVPSVKDRIGINNAAKHYMKFLWLRYNIRQDGAKKYAQFILTDALTSEDFFITETHLDRMHRGINDQNNWYPMFNAFVDYIRENSKTFK